MISDIKLLLTQISSTKLIISLIKQITFQNPNHSMLNILVDKALEKSMNKPDVRQPMFTISYSYINPNSQQSNFKNLKSKTVMNKIPKIMKKDENIFLKWKSKTLQKLKDIELQGKSSFFPNKPLKNLSLKEKSIDHQQIIQQQKRDSQIKQQISPFIVHKKKLTAKIYNLQGNDQKSPKKLSKEQGKNRPAKNPVLRHLQMRRTNEVLKSHAKAMNTLALREEKEQSLGQVSSQNKNVSFINTIQYKTVPKDEINYYKLDKSEQSRKNTLGRTQNIFIRSRKNQTKPATNSMNCTLSTFPSNFNRQNGINPLRNAPYTEIKIRKIYTEKGSRKSTNEGDKTSQQWRISNSGNNYRPWSPVKSNPLFINDDDFLFQQSKTFDIISNLQVPEDMY